MVPEDENKQYRLSGLPKMAKPNESFKKSNQEQRFSEILGQNQQFFNSTSYLVKAHLTSDSDFLFSSGKYLFYLLTFITGSTKVYLPEMLEKG